MNWLPNIRMSAGKGEKNDDSGSEAGDEGNSNVVVENAWAMKLPDFGPEGTYVIFLVVLFGILSWIGIN